MFTSDDELLLYPQRGFKENPHTALCDATSGFYTYSKTYEGVEDFFASVLDKGGIGLDYSCFINCEYVEEFMQEHGIEKFNLMERCVVGNDEYEYVWIVYSRAEIEGWLTLLALSIASKVNHNWQQPLIAMLNDRFDSNKRLTELKQKLSGELDWDFGPVGERATTEYVQNWKKMHNKQLADGYFECVAQAAD